MPAWPIRAIAPISSPIWRRCRGSITYLLLTCPGSARAHWEVSTPDSERTDMTERLADAGTEPSASDPVKGSMRDQISQPTSLGAALLAMGIVYGDLGTSPLYTLQTI